MRVRTALLATVAACAAATASTSSAHAGDTNDHALATHRALPSVLALPAKPDADPFYAQPDPVPQLAPGSLLASRPTTIRALALPVPVQAWQLKYISTDSHGTRIADVATVIRPRSANRGTLVSYQTAQDGLSTDCAPSYALSSGLTAPAEEEAAIGPLLAAGHTVVTADYEGPHSQWTAGLNSGHGVLDGIRATQAFTPAGLPGTRTRTALWGYSGGALASGWANELQPDYAPELNLVGMAAGGVPADIGAAGRYLDGGPASGLYLAAAVGLSRAYPQIDTDALLNARGKAMRERIGTMCISEFAAAYPLQHIADYTTVPDIQAVPSVRAVLRENTLGSRAPGAPVHIYQATHDELIPASTVDTLVKSYCARGIPVQYQRNPIGGHITEAISGVPAALSYLNARLAGTPAPTNC